MSNHPYQFPEDLTGEAARNYVQNEDHEIPTRYERIFVPAGGPFFSHTMRIINVDTGLELAPVDQFKCLHLQNEATLDSGQQVCCVVVITDDDVDHIRISYQAVGGKYGEVVTTLREIVDDIEWDKIARISWGSNVYGKPEFFPPSPHRHDPDDFTGWQKVMVALQSIYQAIIIKDGAVWESVYAYMHRQIKMGTDALGYTKENLDDEFAKVQTAIKDKPIRSKKGRNLIGLENDGVYFNDNYRLVNVTSNYVLKAADIGTRSIIRLTTTASRTITVPKMGATIATGSTVHIRRMTGPTVVAGASGVTITHLTGNKITLETPGAMLTLVYSGSDTWDVMQATVAPVSQAEETIVKAIPVGGVVLMAVPYATPAAFATFMGYGTWARGAEGRAIVGRNTNSTTWTGTVGRTFGTATHTLSLEESPSHVHSQDTRINKFAMRASDVRLTEIDTRGDGGLTVTSSDDASLSDEYAVSNISNRGWELAEEKSRGGGKPHNNVPPSVVMDVWIRIS